MKFRRLDLQQSHAGGQIRSIECNLLGLMTVSRLVILIRQERVAYEVTSSRA